MKSRLVALFACTVTVASLLVAGPPAAAAPAASAPALLPAEAPASAPAMDSARKTGKPVEIVGERTEASQTFAQPDGTIRTKQFATPVRVRQGSRWVDVDPELKPVGDVVVPKATTLDMRFSNGGSGPMLTVVRDGTSMAIA